MCDVDFDGDVGMMTETERKARKAHVCSSCRGAVLPGQRYTVHFSVYDGDPASEKMCSACKADREAFGKEHHFSWCTPSYFPQLLRECIDERDEESMTRWKPVLDGLLARRVA